MTLGDGIALGDQQLDELSFRGRHNGDLHLHDLDEHDRLVPSDVLSFTVLDPGDYTRGLGFYAYLGHRYPLRRGQCLDLDADTFKLRPETFDERQCVGLVAVNA